MTCVCLKLLYKHHFTRKAEGQYSRQLELPEDHIVNVTYDRLINNPKQKETVEEEDLDESGQLRLL